MKLRDQFLLCLAPWFASRLVRILHLTTKTEILGLQNALQFWNEKKNVILVSWHDELLMMPMAYHGHGAQILISSSKDGELIARTVKYWGYDAVRGSSSRGGTAAFREMINLCKRPFDLAITPDGPRGPRHVLKDGVLQLARLGGRPIIPMTYVCSKGYRFSSWDRFLCPYPFGRAVYSYGEPVSYAEKESIESFRQRLSAAMSSNYNKAKERLESYGLSAI